MNHCANLFMFPPSPAHRPQGIPCFGPTAQAAQIEGSKAWSKDFMKRNGIPTAEYRNFLDLEAATEYLREVKHRVVVKVSG